MDLSTLESAVKALEKSLDSLEVWLLFWTALVVLGLIVEYAEDFKDLVTKRPFNWKLFRTMVGGLLITVGVGGELVTQFKASKIETGLRADSHKIEALLNEKAEESGKEAEIVRKEAESYQLDIANAKERAGRAELKAAEAGAKAEGFRLAIAKANERAANANRIAEEERLARLRLQARLADRTLTEAQLKVIADKLRIFAGQEYDVTAYWDSKESVAIAERINQSLQAAGWKFLPMKEWRALLGGAVGVLVWVHPEADIPTKKAAELLVSVLSGEGIEAELREQNPKNNPKHNRISLSIGSKR